MSQIFCILLFCHANSSTYRLALRIEGWSLMVWDVWDESAMSVTRGRVSSCFLCFDTRGVFPSRNVERLLGSQSTLRNLRSCFQFSYDYIYTSYWNCLRAPMVWYDVCHGHKESIQILPCTILWEISSRLKNEAHSACQKCCRRNVSQDNGDTWLKTQFHGESNAEGSDNHNTIVGCVPINRLLQASSHPNKLNMIRPIDAYNYNSLKTPATTTANSASAHPQL